MLLSLIQRVNIVHYITYIKQHEMIGIDADRPLPEESPERANPLTVVEGVQSRFL